MSLVKRAHELAPEMVDIRRRIHANPELAFEEVETSALIEKELRRYGLKTRRNSDATGVIGVLEGGKPGKTIALRADIDALPLAETSGLPFASTR